MADGISQQHKLVSETNPPFHPLPFALCCQEESKGAASLRRLGEGPAAAPALTLLTVVFMVREEASRKCVLTAVLPGPSGHAQVGTSLVNG